MRGKFKAWLILPMVLVCLGWESARGTTFLQFQSTYLGNGWFQYRMDVMNDPFFTEADITGLGIQFTNLIDHVDGTNGWSYLGTNNWEFTNGYPARPYSETFLVRSSDTSYRLGEQTNFGGAIVLLSLVLTGEYPGVSDGTISGNIVGYAMMPCLIPCRPDEADGSPTNFIYTLKLVDDVEITKLTMGSDGYHGVDFKWGDKSTFLLQGTGDFNTWTNIAYIWSDPPETAWTSGKLLNNYGQYFRLALVADGYQSNLPPLSVAASLLVPQTQTRALTITTPRVTGCNFANGSIVVNLATLAGQPVQVQAMSPNGDILQKRRIVPQGSSAKATFGAASLPTPVYFQASAVQ